MRFVFSTEVVDLNIQAPNRNKRECKYFWDELYPLISVGGFDYLEVPYEPKWDFGGRSGIPRSLRSITMKYETVENYVKYLQENGIKGIANFHLDPSLFCGDIPEMYFGAFGHFAEEALEVAAQAGAETLTITASAPIFGMKHLSHGNTELLIQKTSELIDSIAEKANQRGVKLCLKNEYWGLLRGEKIVEFVNNLNNKVYLDVDTAHLTIADVDVASFIEKNKDMIGTVHFTDTSFVDDQEAYLQPLPEFPAKAATKVICDSGQGKVDFEKILSTLKAVGYDGDIIFNCKDSYDIYRSILRAARVAKNIA
ncbi:MAG: sugar phosphate isomerase/epimerase [Pseudobutyrivibrio sp.]|nr:sugar phosphate isomerase/epimerase [Pseudobutyrivibrio sp.]